MINRIKINKSIPSFIDPYKCHTKECKPLFEPNYSFELGENSRAAFMYYFSLMEPIENLWREIAKEKDWLGYRSETLIKMCHDGIFRLRKSLLCEEMHLGYYTMPRSFCYERLSMLYEKRKEYDKALEAIDDYLKYCLYVDDTNTLYKRRQRILKRMDKQ